MRAKLPRIIGTNQLADETALAGEDGMFVRKATNVDIDSAGNVSRRKGTTQLLSGSGYHSLYSSKLGVLMLCYKDELGVLDTSTNQFVSLLSMGAAKRVSYTEMNGNLYISSTDFSCMFKGSLDTAYPIGVPLPTTPPQFTATTAKGGLPAGEYGVAYTVVSASGEESGLSEITQIELESQGAIVMSLLTQISGYRYRVYMTTENGEELYQAAEFDADVAFFEIMDHELGRQPATKNLEQPPYGHIIRAFNSRLLIGSTGFVFFTEAFRPHLHNPAHGFVPITSGALMVEPLDEGAFIGDRRGVRFYKGKDPEKWEVEDASPEMPVYGTSVKVPGSFFTGDLARFDDVIVWLTTKGYQVGLPTGEVVSLNAGQVKLPQYVDGCSTYLIQDGRKQLISPVNSSVPGDSGIALDSSIN